MLTKSTLDQARAVVERANEDIKDLDRHLTALTSLNPYTVFGQANHQRVKGAVQIISPTNEIPIHIHLSVRDIAECIWKELHNILALTAPALDKVSFPTARCNSEFETVSIQRKIDEFPEAVRAIIRSLEPYYGGYGHAIRIVRDIRNRADNQVLVFSPNLREGEAIVRRHGFRKFTLRRTSGSNQKRLVLFGAPEDSEINYDFKIPSDIVLFRHAMLNPIFPTQALLEAVEIACGFFDDLQEKIET